MSFSMSLPPFLYLLYLTFKDIQRINFFYLCDYIAEDLRLYLGVSMVVAETSLNSCDKVENKERYIFFLP